MRIFLTQNKSVMTATKHCLEEHTKEVQQHPEASGDVLTIINRVTTAHTHHSELPRLSEAFEILPIPVASRSANISNAKRNTVIFLVVCANMISVRHRIFPCVYID